MQFVSDTSRCTYTLQLVSHCAHASFDYIIQRENKLFSPDTPEVASAELCLSLLLQVNESLKSLCHDNRNVTSQLSTTKDQLGGIAESLDLDKAIARTNLQKMRHDLTKWEQISNTFNMQVRGYGQIVAGRLGKITRQQLESGQIDGALVAELLRHAIERLNALNETIDRWEITVGFDNFSGIVKDIVPRNSVWESISTRFDTTWTAIRGCVWLLTGSSLTPQESARDPLPLTFHAAIKDLEHQIAKLTTTLSAMKTTKLEAKTKVDQFLQRCKFLESQEGKKLKQADMIVEGLKAFIESLDTLASLCTDLDM